jgi:hypothetical protein
MHAQIFNACMFLKCIHMYSQFKISCKFYKCIHMHAHAYACTIYKCMPASTIQKGMHVSQMHAFRKHACVLKLCTHLNAFENCACTCMHFRFVHALKTVHEYACICKTCINFRTMNTYECI